MAELDTRVVTRTSSPMCGYRPYIAGSDPQAQTAVMVEIKIDLARLRARIIETTKNNVPFSRRSLSLAASDGRNPDLVRDLMRVNLRKPTFETVAGLARAWGDDFGSYLVGVAPAAGKVMLTVRGAVAAGVWREQPEWNPSDWYEIEVGPSPVEGVRHGLVVEGRSMDKTFPPGTVLDCIDLIGSGLEVDEGDYVIVERKQGDLRETTCKRLHLRDDGDWELMAESSLAEFQEPIFLGKPDFHADTENETRVKALVIWAHRPLYKPRRTKQTSG